MTTPTKDTTMETAILATYADVMAERAARIAGWFTEHRADTQQFTHADGRVIEELRWKKPRTSFYSVTYLCRGPHLIVTGDIDDAIYEAGGNGLEFWASCDLDYFAGKCIASRSGRGFRTWDPRIARIALQQTFEESEQETAERFDNLGGWDSLHSREEWNCWMREYGSMVWDDYYEMGDVGGVVDQMCEAHLRGLKMALAQLGRLTRPQLGGR